MHRSRPWLWGLLVLALTTFGSPSLAQTYKDGTGNLPHEMTPEEELIRSEIGLRHRTTPPPSAQPVRSIAEFERMKGVMVRYPLGIGVDIVAEMSEDALIYCIVTASQQQSAYNTFVNGGVNMDNVIFFNAYTDSWWCRDYGPWYVYDTDGNCDIIDVIYNRPRPNDDEIPEEFGAFMGLDVYAPDIIHTGGNWMVDGHGVAVSTDLVYEENPDKTPEEIAEIVHDYCGIETYHVVPDVNGEYIKHIDCWAKFLAVDKIMIREVPPSHSQYDEIEAAVDYFENQISSYGWPYHIYRVYTPNDEPYTNSLILNNKVLVPLTGGAWDDEAIAAYQEAMPGYEILGFYGSWYSTDALHCRTKGVADPGMLYIWSIPLRDTANDEDPYYVAAEIIDYSQAGLIEDQIRVYWRTSESGPFNYQIMTSIAGTDSFYAYIPAQPMGTTVQYYIHAADYSGREDNYPLVGPDGPFSFTVTADEEPPTITNTTDLPSTEDTEGPYYVETTVIDNMAVDQVELFYRVNGGPFEAVQMSRVGAALYRAGIPGQPQTSHVDYYVRAIDYGDNAAYDPPGAPSETYDFYVAPRTTILFTDLESGSDWSHGPVSGGFYDQWHLSTQRNHTPGGTTSWKCGDTGSGNYMNKLDAGLVTEEFELGTDSRLVFWQWVAAETSAAYPGYCYDGGLIEIDTGSGWTVIEPEGGYPFLIREGGNPGPFPAGTGVFSGHRGWHEVTFDLGAFSGTARLRFRFGSDGAGTDEGWYIDDVTVDGFLIDTQSASDLNASSTLQLYCPTLTSGGMALRLALPRSARASLEVLDAQGRVVSTIVSGALQAGSYTLHWDGRDRLGIPVGPGTYFLKATSASGETASRRFIVIR